MRLRADDKGLAQSISRILRAAITEASKSLGDGESTKGIERDANSSAGRLKSIFGDVFGAISKSAGTVLSGALSGARFLALGAAAGAAISGITAMSGALIGVVAAASQAAGAIGILPAAFAALLAVQTTLKLGLKGVGDSFAALASGDVDKFNESLKSLAPAARDFVRSAQGFKPAFDGMQLDVQQRLFAGLGDELTKLGDRFLPLAASGFGRLADELNLTALNVASFLNTDAAFAKFSKSTDNIVTGFSEARQAAGPLTSAILDIVTAGSTQLPRLGTAVQNIASSFSTFIGRAADSGQLEAFFSNSLDVAAQLGRILGDLGVAIGNVFAVGSGEGRGFLSVLETGAQAFRDFTESASGTSALIGFFESVQTVAKQLQPIITSIALAFGNDLAPILTSLASSIGPGVLAIVQQLSPTFQAMAPGIAALGAVFGQLLAAIAPVLPAIGQLVGQLAGALAGALTAALPSITAFIAKITESPGTFAAFAAAVAGLAGAFAFITGPLASLLGALGPLKAVLGPLVAEGGALARVFTVLTGPVGLIIGLFVALFAGSEQFRNAVLGLVSVVGTLVGQLVSALLPVFDALMAAVGPLIEQLGAALAPVITLVTDLLSTVLPPVIAALVPIINSLIPIIMQAADVFGMIIAAVTPVIEIITSALIPIISGLLPIVTTVFNAIANIITAAMRVIQGVIDVVLGLISGDFDRVWSGIQNIVRGAVDLILAVIRGAFSIIGSVIANTWNAAVQLVSSAWSAIRGAVSSGVDGVLSFVRGLPGNIASALGNLGNLLVSAGRDLINGLIAGVKAVAGSIAEAVLAPIRNSVNAVKSFLGISSPSRLFKQIGVFSGEGLIDGFVAMAPKIAREALAMSNALVDATSPALTAGMSLASSSSGGGAGGSAPGNVTVFQTNVAQPGTDIYQFGNQVLRNGQYDLQAGASLRGVSVGPSQAGVAGSDFVPGLGSA